MGGGKGWKLNLPREGVCDYFIFDLQGPTARLRDAGYFDAVWQQTAVRGQQMSR